MNYNKIFIAIVLLIGLLPISSALTCDYKDNPQLEIGVDDIEWVCKTDETFCLSYVKYEDRLLQVNPTPKAVKEIGVVDKYEVNDGVVRVFFPKKNLRVDTNFTFGVKCGDETLEDIITPEYKNLHLVQDQMVRAIDDNSSIILLFVAIIIIIIATGLIVKFFRQRR